jgi:hypothetical protein
VTAAPPALVCEFSHILDLTFDPSLAGGFDGGAGRMAKTAGKAEQRAAVVERLSARLERLADLIHGVSRPGPEPGTPKEEKPPEGTEPEQLPEAPKVVRGELGVAGPILIGATLALR